MLLVKKLHPDAKIPTIAHAGEDLGYDIYSLNDEILYCKGTHKIKTGIAVQASIGLGEAVGLLIRDRSSMAGKSLITVGGVVDAGYTGEIIVQMVNHGYEPQIIKAGDKIAQLVPQPVLTGKILEVDGDFLTTSRGEKGFGSSGT